MSTYENAEPEPDTADPPEKEKPASGETGGPNPNPSEVKTDESTEDYITRSVDDTALPSVTVRAALSWAEKGYNVFPVRAGCKAPPLVKDWPSKATRDPAQIEKWWTEWPDANIAVHCNERNGQPFMVLDVDPDKGGLDTLAKLESALGKLPRTRTHRTPSGGFHYFFTLPEPLGNSVGAVGPGLDVRAQGGYVLMPPSRLAEGGDYDIREGS